MKRRAFLASGLIPFAARAEPVRYPEVTPGRKLVFPRDHGAHPDYRVEWWYVTGWLDGPLGFQVTFFRARPEEASDNPSQFNPRQILFAHAALSDPKRGRLLHDQRAARAGFSLAHAELDRTGVWIDDWRLELEGSRYQARISAREFEFDFTLFATQLVLQGEGGFSRKGHRPGEASYYYSRPQLNVVGKLNGRDVEGTAWLDHEWSSAYMAPEATGWDWCGINFLDGGSLTAFQMRNAKGGVHYAPPGVSFKPLRTWKSPRTGVVYPVEMQVNDLVLKPLMDDQELDARQSSRTIYWEGAVRAFSKTSEIGTGYLELTGYWRPMKL
ncbi:MAG TPA: lipocalin-like domain-containing protein [Burkholderiales bacterium]|nr:lipocalin-like domain-containing protein [Burkholderiales bacterium]